MADKNGDLHQRRNARFSDDPITGMSTCPFKGPEVAIVPMRYALDRSHYDVDPTQLRPLSKEGKWARLPKLKTRTYTLRQLRKGYVYVYDETAKTLHEYLYSALDASLTRVVWRDAEVGQDQRSNLGDSRSHLLYPRNNQLHLAFSPKQWTWRVCEHLRSHEDSRALWMQPLNLKEYCGTMAVRHALQLMDLDSNTVADVDAWPINHDGRFADSAHPPTAEMGPSEHVVPLAADVIWTGSVEDKFSAVMIALDDPLAVMEDFGMQLSADQARLQEWQAEHEHKLSMARIVEHLCGVGADTSLLPASVLKKEEEARKYLTEVEKYFEQLNYETSTEQVDGGLMLGIKDLPSKGLLDDIRNKYGSEPSPDLRESWEKRAKWRREVDLQAARSFVDDQQKQSDLLRQQVRDTQHDLRTWAEHIGTEPLKLFIDTTNPTTLLYLQTIIAELLEILGQDLFATQWLMEDELKAKSLFGVARFGFSMGLKKAFDEQANALVSGHDDLNALFGRAGEVNGFLSHDNIANKPWMQALSEPVQKTFSALAELAKGAGKGVLEKTVLALLAVDSRLAHGKTPSMGTLLRNIAVGHFLMGHPGFLQLHPEFSNHLQQWKDDLRTLKHNHRVATSAWFYNRKDYNARDLGRRIMDLEQGIKKHILNLPLLFDYQDSRYGQVVKRAIAQSVTLNGLAAVKWPERMRGWSGQNGLNAGAIAWGVAIANLINTVMVYGDLSKDGELDKKDWIKLTSAAAYTGNAMMALFVETKWGVMKGLTTTLDGKPVGITERAASFWDQGKSKTKAWGGLIRGFSYRLIGMGGFALVATSAEAWELWGDLQSTQSSTNKTLIGIKLGSVLAMAFIGTIQLVAGVAALAGKPSLLVYAMSPWVAGAAVIAGLIYLATTLVMNYLSQDAIGQWLQKCSWSKSLDERLPDTIAGNLEEQRAFLEIQLSPTLFVKPTYEMQARYVHPVGDKKFPVQNGAWVQLYVPAELRGALLKVNLTASHRPFHVLPIEKLDSSLQSPFVDHGKVIESTALGQVPDTPKQKSPDSVCRPMPPEGESVIWQTWVPLTEQAQHLELQVWYPPEILASGEGDRGYRYRLALEKDGVVDQKDTRISSLDTSSVSVELLGGRDQAVAVAIPY